jgi:hypothetical protein
MAQQPSGGRGRAHAQAAQPDRAVRRPDGPTGLRHERGPTQSKPAQLARPRRKSRKLQKYPLV